MLTALNVQELFQDLLPIDMVMIVKIMMMLREYGKKNLETCYLNIYEKIQA